VAIFGRDRSYSDTFRELVVHLSQTTMRLLESQNKVRQEPTICSDFFNLCIKYLRNCPEIYLQMEEFKRVNEFSLMSMNVEHYDIIESISKYHTELFLTIDDLMQDPHGTSIPEEKIKEIKLHVYALGKEIFSTYISVFLSVPAKAMVEHLTDSIVGILKKFPNEAIPWLQEALTTLPSDCLSQAEKETFCNGFAEAD
jgi:hypothetical protein